MIHPSEWMLAALMALGLAAACGFRVFVPLLVVSLAVRTGFISVSPGFLWLAGDVALVVLLIATALEVGAYYIPWVDNLLDSIATPAAVVAGTVVAASFITGIDPLLKWVLAAVAGGGAAGVVQISTVLTRAISTTLTGGLGNPVVATTETAGAAGVAVASIAWPPLVVLMAIAGVVLLIQRRRRRARRLEMRKQDHPLEAARSAA